MNKKRILGTMILSFGVMLLGIASPANNAYEAYYLYLGDYPGNANPGWHDNAQGIAHDQNNWFITQEKDLWKIPVTYDLNSVSASDSGVKQIRLRDIPELVKAGYNHFGDLEYYESQGYLIIPIEDSVNHFPCSAVAAFKVDNKADNLEYIARGCLGGQTAAPWVAVDPDGNLYSSNSNYDPGSNYTKVRKYFVDWSALKYRRELILTYVDPVTLRDEKGGDIKLKSLQGGVISPSGQLLYLVAGYFGELDPSYGIHVFDLFTGKRVQRSTRGAGHFNYEFEPSFPTHQEPEGLTIWDLDDGRAPNIRGQLHVLLLDNDVSADEVYLKHYTGTIYVNHNHSGEEQGTPTKPFKTVGKANKLVEDAAWDGAQISIRAGSYLETLTFSRRIRVFAEGGPAIVGR